MKVVIVSSVTSFEVTVETAEQAAQYIQNGYTDGYYKNEDSTIYIPTSSCVGIYIKN